MDEAQYIHNGPARNPMMPMVSTRPMNPRARLCEDPFLEFRPRRIFQAGVPAQAFSRNQHNPAQRRSDSRKPVKISGSAKPAPSYGDFGIGVFIFNTRLTLTRSLFRCWRHPKGRC